jgi:hypothetical protein
MHSFGDGSEPIASAAVRPLLVALLAAALAPPATASATVVPQRGMRELRLGMTPAQVRDRLGAPDRSGVTRDPIIGSTRVYRYGLTRVTFDGTSARARVITLSTTSRRERLANGIGVGSTRAAVARRVPRVRCVVEFGVDHCHVGQFRAGRVVTDFRMSSRGRVTRIVIGRVID